MIVIAGTLTVDAQRLTEFTAAVVSMRGQVLAEDGCYHYSLLIEDSTAGLINVVEVWRDDAAHAAHADTPWIREFRDRYGSAILCRNLKVYAVTATRDLAVLPRSAKPRFTD